MFSMQLQWKEFNVNLQSVDQKFKTDYPSNYKGNQSHLVLELWFTTEPSEEEKTAIQTYWDGLTDQSAEATGYVNQTSVNAQNLAKKESGKAKLLALGLTADEILAMVGV